MKKLKGIGIIVTIALMLVSCAKERTEEFVQGQNIDLELISNYQGKNFEVQTQDEIFAAGPATSAVKNVHFELEGLNNFPLVEYRSDAKILPDFAMRARPNHSYTFQYELTDKYLVVNKLGKKAELPSQELDYATEIGPDLFKIPMVGYPIELYSIEKVKNSFGEETHQLAKFSRQDLKSATHFKFDPSSRVLFEAANKVDHLPAKFLEGDWIFGTTVVSSSPEKNAKYWTMEGHSSAYDYHWENVSRINFVFEKDKIRAKNVNQDAIVDTTDTNNLRTAFEIPVEWISYGREQVSKNMDKSFATLKEEIFDDKNSKSESWEKRDYVKIDFPKIVSSYVRILKDSKNDIEFEAKLQDFTLTKNYLSFSIYYPASEVKVKYALKRVERTVPGMTYFQSDRNKFGFFETDKFVIDNYRYYRDEDVEKNVFRNRFYPEYNEGKEKNIIRYYFTSNTAENLKEAGRKAIAAWNEAFQKGGTEFRVVLDESKTVELGDIRYNVLNFVDREGGRLGGYGPSLTDPLSGEIIAATANIYVFSYRESLVRNVRNFIAKELGKFDESFKNLRITARKSNISFGQIGEQSLTGGIDSTTSRQLRMAKEKVLNLESLFSLDDFSQKTLGEMTEFNEYRNMAIGDYNQVRKKLGLGSYQKGDDDFGPEIQENLNDSIARNIHQCDRGTIADNYNFDRMIRECGEVIDYIKHLRTIPGTPTYDPDYKFSELTIVTDCANKLLMENLVDTTLHELGHNFGLRHNFAGSADGDNFKVDEDGKFLEMSSSVMDYNVSTAKAMSGPGAYDVEAIRFGYANQVKAANGELISIFQKRPRSFDESIISERIGKQKNENAIQEVKAAFAGIKEEAKAAVSIAIAMEIEKKEKKHYEYCTDEDRDSLTPMCRILDLGETPLEVVEYKIAYFKNVFATYMNRYGRREGPSSARLTRLAEDAIIDLKGFHDEWRFLLREKLGANNQYLESYSAEEFKTKMEKISADNAEELQRLKESGGRGSLARIKKIEDFKSYTQAAERVFQFFKELAFHSSLYCLMEKKNVAEPYFDLVDFQTVREDIFGQTNLTVHSCEEASDLHELYSNIKSFGQHTQTLKSSLDVEDRVNYNRNEVLGLSLPRLIAGLSLGARYVVVDKHANENFRPSLLDNPIWRQEVSRAIEQRIAVGESVENIGLSGQEVDKYLKISSETKALLEKSGGTVRLNKFLSDKGSMTINYLTMVSSLNIPGRPDISMRNLMPYSLGKTYYPKMIPEGSKFAKIGSVYFYTLQQSDSTIGRLLAVYKNMIMNRELFGKPVSEEVLEEMIAFLKEKTYVLVKGKLGPIPEGIDISQVGPENKGRFVFKDNIGGQSNFVGNWKEILSLEKDMHLSSPIADSSPLSFAEALLALNTRLHLINDDFFKQQVHYQYFINWALKDALLLQKVFEDFIKQDVAARTGKSAEELKKLGLPIMQRYALPYIQKFMEFYGFSENVIERIFFSLEGPIREFNQRAIDYENGGRKEQDARIDTLTNIIYASP